MLYVDAEFYLREYGGSIGESEDFDRLIKRASRLIDVKTHGRAAAAFSGTMKENISICCCELMDVLRRQDDYNSRTAGGLVVSDSNDGYTVTYAGAEISAGQMRREIEAVCETYLLSPVNLMAGWI